MQQIRVTMPTDVRWWQKGVIYQVYPRSFQDSDGNGIGDLRGIRQRLDHLEWLAIDAVWLSPIFPSPMADFGYDVADYTGVDALFGSLADVDALIADVHRRGMRLVLDFVPNHTSERHRWFVDARSSRSAAHRDWYIWREPAPDGGPPNNWQSFFGGSAWELDEQTGQYYFHSFLKDQPDLDWNNAQVRSAMGDVLRFWFERGIDGFRIDVIWLLAKGDETEAGRNFEEDHVATAGDAPHIFDIVAELRAVADEYDDRVLIGEIYLPLTQLMGYYGREGAGLHLPFNFQLVKLDWQAGLVHDAIAHYEELLPPGAWPNWVLGNHDNRRIATRVGAAQARVAVMLLLTLRGTPTLYYGDEIGMFDVDIPPDAERDPQGLRGGASRDPSRTPMRWDSGPAAGFTTGQPWLPIGPAVNRINVRAQSDEPDSMLALHRRLLRLRGSEPALKHGEWQDIGCEGSAIAFMRTDGDRHFLVCLNLASERSRVPRGVESLKGSIVVTTLDASTGVPFDGRRDLAPDEGVVVLLE